MQAEVYRCVDCTNCKLRVPRSLEMVRCSAGVFKNLSVDHPYLIVYRTCDHAEVDEVREGGEG